MNTLIEGVCLCFLMLSSLCTPVSNEGDINLESCYSQPILHPSLYEIKIGLDYPRRAFSGEVVITGLIEGNTSKINLDSGVNVTGIELNALTNNETYEVAEVFEDTSTKELSIEFSQQLFPGWYELRIQYEGEIRHVRGIFGTDYIKPDGTKRYMIATEFQSNYASYAFPCIDQPSFKAKFILNISREVDYRTISNMPLKYSSEVDENNQIWDTFEETPLMSTYTFAFISGDLVDFEAANHNTIWVRSGFEDNTELARKLAPLYFNFMENLTQIPYALPKLDHIAVPFLDAVAMENWGAIIYKEDLLLINDETCSIQKELAFTLSLAHEIIHQWFGNLVTCKSWSYTWMNEGITSYLQYKLAAMVYPQWNLMNLLLSEETQQIMEDEAFYALALTKDGCSIPEADSFSLSSYYKGAILIRMVDHLLSEQSVLEGLRSYLKENAYKSVGEEDLWKHLETAAKESRNLPDNVNFTTVMKSWTHNPGFPYITVSRRRGHIKLQQRRLEYFPSDSSEESWWIPLTYTTSKEKNFSDIRIKGWLRADRNNTMTNIVLSHNEWIIFNIQQTGYFRVNYDVRTWSLLTSQLKENMEVIDPVSRAQLIDDAFTLALHHKIPFDIALNLSTYLQQETNYYPWSAAIKNFNLMRSFSQGAKVRDLMEKYFSTLLEKVYNSIPLDIDSYSYNQKPSSRLLASKVMEFACDLGYKPCEERANETVKLLLSGDREKIKVIRDITVPLMCTMIKNGNEEIWSKALEMYTEEKNTKTKETLLESLTCSQDKFLMKRFIAKVFRGETVLADEVLHNIHYPSQYCLIIDVIDEMIEANISVATDLQPHILLISGSTLPKECKIKMKKLIDKFKSVLVEWNEMAANLNDTYKWRSLLSVGRWLTEELDRSNIINAIGERSVMDDMTDSMTDNFSIDRSWQTVSNEENEYTDDDDDDAYEKNVAILPTFSPIVFISLLIIFIFRLPT